MVNRVIRAVTVVGTAMLVIAPTASEAQYYKGKTITILVGLRAGGGMDTTARLLARYLPKHIPGKPNVIVKNMTGAGGIVAQNYVYERAAPDGLTVLYTSNRILPQALGQKGVRYDYAKTTIVTPMMGAPYVLYGRVDIVPGGLKRPQDIMKARHLKLASTSVTSPVDMMTRPALDLLGLKYIYVSGYRGGAALAPAVRRGEANLAAASLPGYRARVEPTMVKEGIVKGIWYYPQEDEDGNFTKSPLVPDMPSYLEVYKRIYGKPPSGKYWRALKFVLDSVGVFSHNVVGPPNMNKKALALLRQGFEGVLSDPQAIAEQKKVIGFALRLVSYKAAEKAAKNVGRFDPKLIAFWKGYIKEAQSSK